MTRAACLLAATLLAGVSAPLAAQAPGDPAHLDDFAVNPGADSSLQVEQVSPGADALRPIAQPQDRTIATPQPSTPRTTGLRQISRQGQPSAQPQLSKAGGAPDETQAAVSSTADSRPRGVVRISGHDRCDPQLAGEELARCRQILELRAQEFNAPAPPQLSAEQQLLAEQRAEDEQPGRSPATRLRLASRDAPDADLQSNQELAALYLARQQNPPVSPASPQDEAANAQDASLAQILRGLEIQTAGSAPPP